MNKIRVTKRQFERIKLAYRVIGFCMIVSLLFAFSLLVRKHIEFAFIFLPYFLTKGLYSNQWHSDSLKECYLLSLGLFAFDVCFVLPKSFSIAFSLFIGVSVFFFAIC